MKTKWEYVIYDNLENLVVYRFNDLKKYIYVEQEYQKIVNQWFNKDYGRYLLTTMSVNAIEEYYI